jgi:hypothetical protein
MRRLNEVDPSEWDQAYKDLIEQKKKITSDGGSSDYYKIPDHCKEVDDLIVYKKMPWRIANIFKACYRWDEKEGNDMLYDANKIEWFIRREIKDLLGELK